MPATHSIKVLIVHAASEPQAHEFSVRFAAEVPDLIEAELVDIESLDPSSQLWPLAGAVYVLSPAALVNEKVRARLVKTAQFVGFTAGTMLYYVCVDCNRASLLREYPDLAELFELALVSEEKDREALVAQLKKFTIKNAGIWTPGLSVAGHFAAMLLQMLGMMPTLALTIVHPLLFLWPFLLLAWLLWANPTGRFLALAGAWLCVVQAGTLITQMGACDFWPWLGCRSRVSRQPLSPSESLESLQTGIYWGLRRTWASGEALRSRSVTAGEDCRTCSPRELREAEIGWKFELNLRRVMTPILLLAQAGIPVYVIVRSDAGNAVLIIMAFVAGAIIPLLFTATSRSIRLHQQAKRGLSSSRLSGAQIVPERISGIERRLSGRGRGKTMTSTGLTHYRWLLKGSVQSLMSPAMFPKPPFVFLSYSRADDVKSGHVAVVAESLRRLGIGYYLDREAQANMSTWRREAAISLEKASHVLVFAGPGALASNAVQRELRDSLERTPNQLPPAIICVTDCYLSRGLLKTTDLSPEWQFVLTWCAQLWPAELTDPEELGLLIRQRMRQGLLRDWATHLGLGPSPLRTTLALIESSEAPPVLTSK